MRTKQLQAIAVLTLTALLASEGISQRRGRFRRPSPTPSTQTPTIDPSSETTACPLTPIVSLSPLWSSSTTGIARSAAMARYCTVPVPGSEEA